MAKYWTKSTDVGAPVITGQNDSVRAAVATLAAAAGLSVPYSGTNKCIVQTSTGSFLRFVHDNTVSGDARLCTIRGCEGATGIDTYTDAYPLASLEADTVANLLASTTANSTPRAWWSLIDTTKHCWYLFIDTASAGAISSGLNWFRAEPVFTPDPYNEWIHVRNTTSATSVSTPPFEVFNNATSGASWNFWGMRSKDGVTKSVRGALGPYFVTAFPGGGLGAQAAPSIDGNMRLDRSFVTDFASQSSTVDTSRAEVKRGYVPNVLVPLHSHGNYSGYTCGEEFNDPTYGDCAFFPFTGSNGSRGAIVLEIG